MADTVYEMMIKLGLDHAMVMTGLGAIGARLTTLHKQAMDVKLALGGIGAIALAGVTVEGIVKITEATKGLSRELTNLKNLNGALGNAAASGALTTQAYNLSKVVPMKVEDLLQIRRHAAGLFDTPEDISNSEKLWEPLAKYAFSKGLTGEEGMNRLRTMLKAGENLGRITDDKGNVDIDKAKNWIDMAQRITSASGGLVNEQQLYGLSQQLGFAGRGLSDEGMYTEAMLTEIMGGRRVGTAGLSLWQQFARGQMTGKTAQAMERIGLLGADEYSIGKRGTVEVSEEAKKRLTAQIGEDPLKLAEELDRNLEKMGVKDQVERMRLVADAFGRQTTERLTAEMVMNREQMLRSRKMFSTAGGNEEQFQNRLSGDIQSNVTALADAWHNLLAAIGGPNGKNIIDFLQSVTHVFQDWTNYIRGIDPEKMAALGRGIAELAVAFGAAGMVAVIAAIGPAGWVAGGLMALAAVNYKNLEQVVGWITKLANVLGYIEKASASPGGGDNPFAALTPNWMKNWLAPTQPPPAPDNAAPEVAPSYTNPNINPMNFTTGGGGQKQLLQPIMIKLDLDGRTLGQAVADIMEDLYSHDEQAPSGNGIVSYSGPGGSRYST